MTRNERRQKLSEIAAQRRAINVNIGDVVENRHQPRPIDLSMSGGEEAIDKSVENFDQKKYGKVARPTAECVCRCGKIYSSVSCYRFIFHLLCNNLSES